MLSPSQAFANMKSGIVGIMKETDNLLKSGQVGGVTQEAYDKAKSKNGKYYQFLVENKIKIAAAGSGRAGGNRTGKLEAVLGIFKSESHPAVAITRNIITLEKQLSEQLKTANRSLSPGYVRGLEANGVETPAAKTQAAPAPSPAK